jgi:hypothetical protein
VLLAGQLELAAEHVRGPGDLGLDVSPLQGRPATLEAVRGDRLAQPDQCRQRLVGDLHRERPEPGGLERLPEHPAHGVPVEHHLAREERLVGLHPGVVDAGNVVGGEDPHDAGDVERGGRVQSRDPGVRVRCLHRVRVQDAAGAADEVVGVEGVARDVQLGRLVRDRLPHDGIRRSAGHRGHAVTAGEGGVVVRAWSRGRAVRSMAER